jgi:hypothetical protein
VAVEAVAVAVIASRGARVGVVGGVLDVAQGCAFVEGERDESVAQRVGVEVGETDLPAEALDQLPGVLARETSAA